MTRPQVVSSAQWQDSRDELLKAEKEATRALDALAARRRRLPMMKMEGDYTFDTPDGPRSLVDLFDGRDQLVVYQFMDRGPGKFCPGCTNFTDNVPIDAVRGLGEAGISWVTISDMPLEQIQGYKSERGWRLPFVSSHGTPWSADIGAGPGFLLCCFIREGDEVFLTYKTTQRGVDRLLFTHNVLDLTVWGRQEEWEDSPDGWPQQPTYG